MRGAVVDVRSDVLRDRKVDNLERDRDRDRRRWRGRGSEHSSSSLVLISLGIPVPTSCSGGYSSSGYRQASPSVASQSRSRSASPKPSFWQKLKAENEERKQKERQNVSAKEATRITGYGSENKPYAYSDGAVMELLMNGYVDPKIRKSREEAKKLADTGKRYNNADTGKKEP
ncbi:uncharacterized protein CC84DRAFT_1202002 [Paraphaeosphaeria sporulosa]|uniref:Uncharacterized protein n=1 Tax=Paraphaeosphaeria sporulosa TaxID=1460663 RepID=A0A177CQL9_9PLEO|nr:uncharacterized protein CC84DRAFT_1202002 [Paraphaeosphaeria sporulosa]OAG09190.1 hypothetical protein CC84DRAFT_1202002 [Paraphaeosphaeria sporulosa]